MMRYLMACIVICNLFSRVADAEPINLAARESVGYILQIVSPTDASAGKSAEAHYLATAFAATYVYGPDVTKQFIVTARHVVVDDSGKGRKGLFVQFKHEETGRIRLFALKPEKWLFHPLPESIDLAVYPGLPSRIQVRRVSHKIWMTEETLKQNNIDVGDEAFYTGLLIHFPGNPISIKLDNMTINGLVDSLSPITRFGRLAHIDDSTLFMGRLLYFLDADNMPGHSGAPVFLWATAVRRSSQLHVGPRIFGLYGVVSNVLEWGKGIRFVANKRRPQDYRSGGVTGIVPVKYLRELIEANSAKTAFGVTD